MTPEQFKTAMETIAHDQNGDTEADHCNADDLMCKVLRQLGYGDGVDIFEKMHKWYA